MNLNLRRGIKPALALALAAAAWPCRAQVATVEAAQGQVAGLVGSARALKTVVQATKAPVASASTSETTLQPGENFTISDSGFKTQDEAQANLDSTKQGLAKAGYEALSGHVTSQELPYYTADGERNFDYDVTYIGPASQVVSYGGFGSQTDAEAEMNSVAAKLGGYVVLSKGAYALPQYGTYAYKIRYIAEKPK